MQIKSDGKNKMNSVRIRLNRKQKMVIFESSVSYVLSYVIVLYIQIFFICSNSVTYFEQLIPPHFAIYNMQSSENKWRLVYILAVTQTAGQLHRFYWTK